MCVIQPVPRAAKLVQVCLREPAATFALAVAGGKVVAAAPIAQWTVGRPYREVTAYYQRRHAKFRLIP